MLHSLPEAAAVERALPALCMRRQLAKELDVVRYPSQYVSTLLVQHVGLAYKSLGTCMWLVDLGCTH